MKRVLRRALVLGFLGVAPVMVAAKAQRAPVDLTELKIEDLMNVDVTSASKKAQKISRVPAAIFVITADDIERSGATNVPDLLRMVPGLEVAQINASSWAISARGFNGQYSNKLLVLIDGRTVYAPIFSGVYWDALGLVLDEIKRIEIIRGPGATIWGANAVNGVINILTKAAGETQGATLRGHAGTIEHGGGAARYGGKIGGQGTYRLSADGWEIGQFLTPDKKNGQDDWYGFHAGFRADAELSPGDSVTVEGGTVQGNEGELSSSIISIQPPVSELLRLRTRFSGWDVVARWKHAPSPAAETSLQVYFDRRQRGDSTYGFGHNTLDLDFQQHLARRGNDLVWGLGYRLNSDDTLAKFRISFQPADLNTQIFNAFLQDEIAIRPDHLYLTVGTKVEHEYFNGFNFQPTIRLTWIPNDRGMFWTAFSGAQRTPSRVETGIVYDEGVFPGPSLPTLVRVYGNPHFANEHLAANEAGLRRDLSDRLSLDATVFYNRYHDLRSYEPGLPSLETNPPPLHVLYPFGFGNLLHGENHGVEVFANLKLNNRWTLSPGYSFLAMHLHRDPHSQDDITVPVTEGGNPSHQAQLRSNVNLRWHCTWTTSAYFVDRLPAQAVPSYTRLDTNLAWHPTKNLSVGVVGQNLGKNLHPEYNGTDLTLQPSLVRRSGYAWLTWHY